MQRHHVKYALLILVTAGVGYVCILMVLPFLMAIAWAAVVAIIISPVFDWVLRKVRSPSLAALLTCTFAIVAVLIPIVVAGVVATRTVIGLIGAQEMASATSGAGLADWVDRELVQISEWAREHIGIEGIDRQSLADALKQAVNALADQSRRFLGGVAGFFFNLIIVVFTLFFFLRDRKAILSAVRGFLPLSDENTNAVFERVETVIRASVIGGGAVALAQGILLSIGFAILGLPSPLLWGLLTCFCSFIPFVGAAGIWVPAVLLLLFNGFWGKAIILACWGTFIVSMVDNVLRPILIGDATKLHTLLIFFGILGGLQVFGFLGLIMGPVMLAVGLALADIFRREILENEERRRVTGQLPDLPG